MPTKINLLSKPKLAKENRKAVQTQKLNLYFNKWAAFCKKNSRIRAVFSGTSLTMKDSTE
jgi:hypothetical protein